MGFGFQQKMKTCKVIVRINTMNHSNTKTVDEKTSGLFYSAKITPRLDGLDIVTIKQLSVSELNSCNCAIVYVAPL